MLMGNEENTPLSFEDKENMMVRFNQLYYSNNTSFKGLQLPYWMRNYGQYLAKELKGNLPIYYPKFSAGTIVMTDFGVRVGDELSGGHFAVVINNDDSKYQRNITVVPLTSKYHKGHVRINNEIFVKAINLAHDRAVELSTIQQELDESHERLVTQVFEFLQTLKTDTIRRFVNFFYQAIKNNIPLELPNEFNSELLSSPTSETAINELLMVNDFISETSKQVKQSSARLKEITPEVNEITKLLEKLDRYNNDSFVDVSNITTISKLRVKKITRYTITGNISLSKESMQKIKKSLLKRI
ncbi:hypothetical protein C6P25_04170 [Weissella confusa]|nr:hypothetical protein C6P25_04170 [Weissella confusa]